MTPILTETRIGWASAIGLFLLNFGTLEFLVADFLEAHMEPQDFTGIRKLQFKDRVARVGELLNRENSDEEKKRLGEFLTRLDPIRDLRNRIAHGYLLARPDKEGKAPAVTLSLPNEVDLMFEAEAQHLKFEDLTSALAELREIIPLFQAVSGRWSEPKTFPIAADLKR